MERQATQPAAVPTGRKRRRVCGKKKNLEEAKAQALDMQATQPPTSELVIALNHDLERRCPHLECSL